MHSGTAACECTNSAYKSGQLYWNKTSGQQGASNTDVRLWLPTQSFCQGITSTFFDLDEIERVVAIDGSGTASYQCVGVYCRICNADVKTENLEVNHLFTKRFILSSASKYITEKQMNGPAQVSWSTFVCVVWLSCFLPHPERSHDGQLDLISCSWVLAFCFLSC